MIKRKPLSLRPIRALNIFCYKREFDISIFLFLAKPQSCKALIFNKLKRTPYRIYLSETEVHTSPCRTIIIINVVYFYGLCTNVVSLRNKIITRANHKIVTNCRLRVKLSTCKLQLSNNCFKRH